MYIILKYKYKDKETTPEILNIMVQYILIPG